MLPIASGVKHGRHVCRVLAEKHNIECGFVCGETPDADRNELLAGSVASRTGCSRVRL